MQWESPKCLDPNLREIYGSDRSIGGSTDSKSKLRETKCIIRTVSLVETNRIIRVNVSWEQDSRIPGVSIAFNHNNL